MNANGDLKDDGQFYDEADDMLIFNGGGGGDGGSIKDHAVWLFKCIMIWRPFDI